VGVYFACGRGGVGDDLGSHAIDLLVDVPLGGLKKERKMVTDTNFVPPTRPFSQNETSEIGVCHHFSL
jgi:hypothetical protein